MEAEINNDAAGWNDPSLRRRRPTPSRPMTRRSRATSPTPSSVPASTPAAPATQLTVGLGHTGDYNGYTVSYREYEARDSYRKALTATARTRADYMVTNLLGMAANLHVRYAVPTQPTDPIATADEQRQRTRPLSSARSPRRYYNAWNARVPNSVGPAAVISQPQQPDSASTPRRSRWVGGDNWTDNPTVTVQRRVGGAWKPYADQSGADPDRPRPARRR